MRKKDFTVILIKNRTSLTEPGKMKFSLVKEVFDDLF